MGQPCVGLARDLRQAERPAEAQGAIARSRIVVQGKLRTETGPGVQAIGTDMEPVPLTGLAANFSPMPRMAPPPFGSEIDGRMRCAGLCRWHLAFVLGHAVHSNSFDALCWMSAPPR